MEAASQPTSALTYRFRYGQLTQTGADSAPGLQTPGEVLGLVPAADTREVPLHQLEPAHGAPISLVRSFVREDAAARTGEMPVVGGERPTDPTDTTKTRVSGSDQFADWPTSPAAAFRDSVDARRGDTPDGWWTESLDRRLRPDVAKAVTKMVDARTAEEQARADRELGRQLMAAEYAAIEAGTYVEPDITHPIGLPETQVVALASRYQDDTDLGRAILYGSIGQDSPTLAQTQADTDLDPSWAAAVAKSAQALETLDDSPRFRLNPMNIYRGMKRRFNAYLDTERQPRVSNRVGGRLAFGVGLAATAAVVAGPTYVALNAINGDAHQTTKVEAAAIPGGNKVPAPDAASERPAAPVADETDDSQEQVIDVVVEPYSSTKTDAAGNHRGTPWSTAHELLKKATHGEDVSMAENATLAHQIDNLPGVFAPGNYRYTLELVDGKYRVVQAEDNKDQD